MASNPPRQKNSNKFRLWDVVLKHLSTLRDIETGLSSPDVSVRRKFAQSLESSATPEQIERGLLDEDSEVRIAFISSCGFQPTPAQIERGLTDEDGEVRFWFVTHPAIELSPEQIQRGLKDEYSLIPLEIASRYNCDLVDVPTLGPMFEKMFEINGTKVRDKMR